MRPTIIPSVIPKDQVINFLGPDDVATTAARMMRDRRVAAVMVVEADKLIGIVTERDIVFKITAEGTDPSTVRLDQLMTRQPETLRPTDGVLDALEKMQTGRYRHLPVLDGDKIMGMVSIRDIFTAARRSLEEDLHAAESLINGEPYGLATH